MEIKLRAEIEKAQQEYHEKAQGLSQSKAQEMTDKIAELKNRLVEILTDGAENCPHCDEKPHGMKKGRGMYEIGCVKCLPVEKNGIIIYYAAQGETSAEAVQNWNNGVYKTKPVIL